MSPFQHLLQASGRHVSIATPFTGFWPPSFYCNTFYGLLAPMSPFQHLLQAFGRHFSIPFLHAFRRHVSILTPSTGFWPPCFYCNTFYRLLATAGDVNHGELARQPGDRGRTWCTQLRQQPTALGGVDICPAELSLETLTQDMYTDKCVQIDYRCCCMEYLAKRAIEEVSNALRAISTPG